MLDRSSASLWVISFFRISVSPSSHFFHQLSNLSNLVSFMLFLLLFKLQSGLDESSDKIILNLDRFGLFLDHMHSISIIGSELCLQVPSWKGLAESTPGTFLSIWIYLRICMSPTMAVTYLCFSRLWCILYAFCGFGLGLETGIGMRGDRVVTFLCTTQISLVANGTFLWFIFEFLEFYFRVWLACAVDVKIVEVTLHLYI